MMRNTRFLAAPECGVAMVEILVSLLILTIGALGLAGLQFYGIKFNHSSYERSQATTLAYALADTMRANQAQAAASAYALTRGATPPTATDCSANTCTPSQLAAYNLSTWFTQLQGALAGGTASVSCADSPCTLASQQVISVFWPEPDLQGAQGAGASAVLMASCAVSGAPAGTSCISIVFQP